MMRAEIHAVMAVNALGAKIKTSSPQIEKGGQLFDGRRRAVAGAKAVRGDQKFSARAVGLGVDVSDNFQAGEDGQRVVAAFPFGRRRVNFPRVVESPETLRDAAVVDEGIEGREQQRRACLPLRFGSGTREAFENRNVFAQAEERRTIGDGDRLHEIFDPRQLIALEGDEAALAQLQVGEPAGGVFAVGFAQSPHAGGQDALGKIVAAAVLEALGDQEAAVEKEFLERRFHERRLAPDLAVGAAVVGEILGAERAARGDLGEQVRGEFAFARGEFAR